MAPLTLIVAPAGYGKTTLVQQWAATESRRVAWVSLDREANHVTALCDRLVRALGAGSPDPHRREQTAPADLQSVLDIIAQTDDELVLVLDDMHHIDDDEGLAVVLAVSERLPPRVRLLAIGRVLPRMSLGRGFADGHVRLITDADLQFTVDEVERLARIRGRALLAPSQIDHLTQRTGGWVAALQLALSSVPPGADATTTSIVDAWEAGRWIDAYVREEVLALLPAELSRFAIHSALLPELFPELCDTALEIANSEQLLTELARWQLVKWPEATAGARASYSPILRDSLGRIASATLQTTARRELLGRAIHWYERSGAFDHVFELAVLGEDWDLATRAVRRLCVPYVNSDLHHACLDWLERLPRERVLAEPDLAHWYLSALMMTGRLREARAMLPEVDRRWRAPSDPVHLGHSAKCRAALAMIGDDADRALRLAYQALDHYPHACHVERLHTWFTVMRGEVMRGRDDRATDAFRQAQRCRDALPGEQYWWTAVVLPERANQYALRGRLRTARAMLQDLLDATPGVDARHLARYRYRLAAIDLEWNQVDRAWESADLAERELLEAPPQLWHRNAWVQLVRVFHAAGEHARVRTIIQRLRALAVRQGGQRFERRLEALEALIWLETGRLDLARAWVEGRDDAHGTRLRAFGAIDPQLVLARIELASGDLERAIRRLESLVRVAREQRRWAELVSLHAWQAVARSRVGDQAAARDAVRHALELGERGEFRRSFIAPGEHLVQLIEAVLPTLTSGQHRYTRTILQMVRTAAGRREPDRDRVVEPAVDPGLSERELQVLAGVREGLSNREIGDRLYITERTVKKHVASALRKLGVPNRTAAVLRALDLGILG